MMWTSAYWCDFHSEKMRFTLQVFLEVLSSRPAFVPIVQKLARMVFRELPSDADLEATDWGNRSDEDTLNDGNKVNYLQKIPRKPSIEPNLKLHGRSTSVHSIQSSLYSGSRSSLVSSSTISNEMSGDVSTVLGPMDISMEGVSLLDISEAVIVGQLNMCEFELFSRIEVRTLERK